MLSIEQLPDKRRSDRSKKLRIALIADGDANDRDVMSGTPYYCARALEQTCGPVHILGVSGKTISFGLRLANALQERLTGRRYAYSHNAAIARLRSRSFAKQIDQLKVDAVFSAKDCKGIAFLDVRVPIVYFTDATVKGMLGYYPSFSNLYGFSQREANRLEHRALCNADRIVTPSDWAADSVVHDYAIPADKVAYFPFGSKLDLEIDSPSQPTQMPSIKLLFIGKDWKRKGGDIAVQIVERLNEQNMPAELVVLGCKPEVESKHITTVPYLNKNSAAARKTLGELYRSAHFFVLPVKQEAAGSVFIEATALGLPCLANRTGGVSAMVREGVNGHTFHEEHGAQVYVDQILTYARDAAAYRALRASTLDFARTEANWKVWGERVRDVILSCA